MKKISRFLLIIMVLVTGAAMAEAQQPAKVSRIGFLSGRVEPTPANPDPIVATFQQALRDLGYVEGKNISD